MTDNVAKYLAEQGAGQQPPDPWVQVRIDSEIVEHMAGTWSPPVQIMLARDKYSPTGWVLVSRRLNDG